ncbi:MAG: hypothetical protein ACYC1Z_08385, partial [Georgenia sp.]
ASLHHCIIASLHHCIIASLHHCIIASLHHCIIASLHQDGATFGAGRVPWWRWCLKAPALHE